MWPSCSDTTFGDTPTVNPSVANSRLIAQTLDQQAWNEVWDRFDKIFPKGNDTNIIHALEVPVPATWADASDLDTLRDLQRIAGAIPEEKYVLEPSRMQRTLQDVYTEIVLSVELPNLSPEQRAKFQAALDKFETARLAYEARAKEFDGLWDAEVTKATAKGHTVDSRDVLQFRKAHPNYFDSVVAQMNLAVIDVQRFDSDAPLWVNAVRALRSEYSYSTASTSAPGVWTYHGGTSILKTIATDCTDGSDKGVERLTFDSNTTATTIRNSGWNGSGGWGGTFFSLDIGGGGTNYSQVVTSGSESVSLRFCKMTYIPLYAGTWLSVPFLQAIDRGEYKLKQEKLSQDLRGKKILGPDGLIPRLVKGAIVARNISLEAKLGTTNLNEFKKHIDGSGGLRIGPFNIGGGGGSDEYSRTYTAQNGAYGRSTDFSVPAIIAIITEPTNDGPATAAGATGTKGAGTPK